MCVFLKMKLINRFVSFAAASAYETSSDSFLGFPSTREEGQGKPLEDVASRVEIEAARNQVHVINLKINGTKDATAAQGLKSGHVIELKNYMNVQYYGDFRFSHDQHLPAIYDTGSFEILTLSTQCEKCVTLKRNQPSDHPPLYNRANSDHFHLDKNGLRAEHVFGSGPVTSSLAYDDISFGGFTVKDMPFWEIEKHDISAWEVGAKFSAIVGLGKENRAPVLEGSQRKGIPTLLQKAGVASFSICLNRGPGNPSGHLELNGHLPAPSVVVPVIADNHWGVRLSAINMKGSPPIPVCLKGCAAVIDSGTSLLVMPSIVANQLKLSSFSINEDCSNVHSLPNMEVTLDGKLFSLSPSAYVVKEDVQVVVAGRKGAQMKTICSAGFTIMDDMPANHGPLVILGMPFLRRFKTTFVRDTDRAPAVLHIQRVDRNCNADPLSISNAYQSSPATSSAFHVHQTTVDVEQDDEPVLIDKLHIRPPRFLHKTVL